MSRVNNKKRNAAEDAESGGRSGRDDDDDDDDDSDDDEQDGHELGAFIGMPSSSSSSSSSSSTSAKKKTKPKKPKRKDERAEMTKEDAEEAFGEMEGRRIGDSCKEKYKGMMAQITNFGNTHYEDLMNEDGSLPCPIPTAIVRGFFGTLTKDGNDRDKFKGVEDLEQGMEHPTPLSHSHVRTHGSAVKDFYKQNGMSKVNEEVAMCMSDVIGSYKKCIASLKKKGLYKCNEGKRPLLFQGFSMLCALFLDQKPTQRSGQAN
jgi:hypothetical protein